jgi:hypothetical protein
MSYEITKATIKSQLANGLFRWEVDYLLAEATFHMTIDAKTEPEARALATGQLQRRLPKNPPSEIPDNSWLGQQSKQMEEQLPRHWRDD